MHLEQKDSHDDMRNVKEVYNPLSGEVVTGPFHGFVTEHRPANLVVNDELRVELQEALSSLARQGYRAFLNTFFDLRDLHPVTPERLDTED